MNYPMCALVSDDLGNGVIVAVTDGHSDGLYGCHWTIHAADGRMVRHGFSRALPGAALVAMKNGKAAAKRWLRQRALALGRARQNFLSTAQDARRHDVSQEDVEMVKEQKTEQERAREKRAKRIANRVVEKSRRAIKPPAKVNIAQGWWTGLKADVAAAILAGC